MTKPQATIWREPIDHPDRVGLGISDPIAPKASFNLWQTPAGGMGALHAAIESQQPFGAPVVEPLMRWAQQSPQSNASGGNRIVHIHPKPNSDLPQLSAAMNQTRQNSGQLASMHQEVIGPFDPYRQTSLLQTLRHRRNNSEPQQTGAGERSPLPWQCRTDPETSGRSLPDPSPLASGLSLMPRQQSTRTIRQRSVLQPTRQQGFGAGADGNAADHPWLSHRPGQVSIGRHQSTTAAAGFRPVHPVH